MSADYVRRLFGLEGQTAVVIGGSGRIGGAICESLGRTGVVLVIAGRSASRGHKRVEVVRALGGAAGFRQVDICQRNSIQQLLNDTLGEHGQVDILVTSVSSPPFSIGAESDEQVRHRLLDVQARGPNWASEIFAAQMARQKQGGSILHVHGPLDFGPSPARSESARQASRGEISEHASESSVGEAASSAARQQAAGNRGRREGVEGSTAARVALLKMTRASARRWAPRGVRINSLCLNHFVAPLVSPHSAHDLTQSVPAAVTDADEIRSGAAGADRESLPRLGRWGVPEDAVGAVLLLISRSAAAFVTGAELHVNGGESVEGVDCGTYDHDSRSVG